MRILVTGSSGRIGNRIAKKLAQKHDVIGLDIKNGDFTTLTDSILNHQLVKKLCKQVDAVVHTASLHAPHVGIVPDCDFRETNIMGTRILLESSIQGSVTRFIYTSTTSLYGLALIPQSKAVWVTEDLEPVARDIYDETKIAAEKECEIATQSGLICISLRMSRCFPEADHLVAIYRLYRGVDSRDVVQAHMRALDADLKGFQIFNISAASPFKRDDAAELLSNAGEVILKYYPWAEREFDFRCWQMPTLIDRIYVIEKAQKMLGYQPKYNFASLFNMKDA